MKRIIYKDGIINLIDEINGATMAVTQTSMSPVNLKAMPPTAQIAVDKIAFDRMCMDYVRANGEDALVKAAEMRPGKQAAILEAATHILISAAWEGDDIDSPDLLDKCILIAEKMYDKVEAKKY